MKKGFVMIESAIWLAILGIIAAIFIPNMVRVENHGDTTACRSQLQDMRTSLFQHSRTNNGRYPSSLKELGLALECPANGEYVYRSQSGPDLYLLACPGTHLHQRFGTSYFVVSNTRGFEVIPEE